LQPVELGASQVVVGPRSRFSIAGALSQTLRLWSIDLPLLLGVAIIALVPRFLVMTTLWLMEEQPNLASQQIEIFLDRVMGFVAAGLVTPLVLDRLRGRSIDRRRSLALGISRLGPVTRAAIGTSFYIAVQLLLLVIPGVVASIRWALVGPVCAAEPEAEVRDRSETLTAGHGWELFGVLLVVNAGLVGVQAVVQAVGVRSNFQAFALLLPLMLFVSFESVLRPVLYEELRTEKEGPDVSQLAASSSETVQRTRPYSGPPWKKGPGVRTPFCLKTTPSFITNCTSRSASIFSSGLPGTAIRSAKFPGLIGPRVFSVWAHL
jgi:hypothetical protein